MGENMFVHNNMQEKPVQIKVTHATILRSEATPDVIITAYMHNKLCA